MYAGSKSKHIQKYLELMAVLPAPSPQTMQTITLERLRSSAPQKITQQMLGDALGRTREHVNRWEKGLMLDGISSTHMLIMAALFNRPLDEVVAAIENTRIPEETPPDAATN